MNKKVNYHDFCLGNFNVVTWIMNWGITYTKQVLGMSLGDKRLAFVYANIQVIRIKLSRDFK